MRIAENAGSDRSLQDLRASDADSGENALLDYELSQLSDWRTPSPFRVDAEGQLRLKPGASLDREAVAQYSFEVVARDRGRPQRSATAAVTVTVTGAHFLSSLSRFMESFMKIVARPVRILFYCA